MMVKQGIIYLQKNKQGGGVFMMEDKERAFRLQLEQERKKQERIAIRALIDAKKSRIDSSRQTSTTTLNELSEAMHQQTRSILPNALSGALQGKGAEAANNFLTQLTKPAFKTPVK